MVYFAPPPPLHNTTKEHFTQILNYNYYQILNYNYYQILNYIFTMIDRYMILLRGCMIWCSSGNFQGKNRQNVRSCYTSRSDVQSIYTVLFIIITSCKGSRKKVFLLVASPLRGGGGGGKGRAIIKRPFFTFVY